MALQSSITKVPLVRDGRHVIVRIQYSDRKRLEKHLFQRYPDREWGTFFHFGFRRTAWGIALSYVGGLWPESSDLDRQSDIVEFSDDYNLRAFRSGSTSGVGVGVVHSHPSGYSTHPSALDDDMDDYFARELSSYTGGFPYCSLIFQRNDQGFSFSGRVYDRGEWLPVKTLFTTGEVLQRDHSELMPSDSTGYEWTDGESTTARLEALLGEPSALRLQGSCVGIIGCSGTGTPAGHLLARAKVGEFVLVDPQRFAPSNHERFHASVYDDLMSNPLDYKVELLARLIQSVNPHARITTLVGNALQDNVLDELLRCDLILGCTDTVHGRVFLSDVAKHNLLPSIDVGVDMDGDNGKVTTQLTQLTRYSPELPCAFCNGVIDTNEMAVEFMTDEEKRLREKAALEAEARGEKPDSYWRRQRQMHTVGYLTTTAGAMAAGYAEGWLTGAFAMPHAAFQFDLGQERLGVVPTPPRQDYCICGQRIGWADQAQSYRNVARPTHWAPRALLLSSGAV
ncbi:MAG: ThiF family adenylyltransferase [Rhodopirellula sp.]|nr:ThiF family adenylyltransferase [Rhodopirellula sp.]